jgi:hypothetical protein
MQHRSFKWPKLNSNNKKLLPPSQNKWLNWPWVLSQNKWLLCFIALIQVVLLDQQGWNHNIMWEEVALPAPICVSWNVALYSCFLHTSQSCSIAGSKRHCSTTWFENDAIIVYCAKKNSKIGAMSLLLFCRI